MRTGKLLWVHAVVFIAALFPGFSPRLFAKLDDTYALIKEGKTKEIAKRLDADPSLANKFIKYHSYAILCAIECGRVEIVKLLIDKGAKVDVVDPKTKLGVMHTLALTSARSPKAFLPTLEMLAKKKAQLNVIDEKTGMTPLSTVLARSFSTMKHVEVRKKFVTALLERGAKMNLRGKDASPILITVFDAYKYSSKEAGQPLLEMVRFLLEKGAELDAMDQDKNTFFLTVLRRRAKRTTWPEEHQVELLKYILAQKPNMYKKNKKRESPKSILSKEKDFYKKIKPPKKKR